MRVAVIGGSVTGLWTAATLADAGHEVTVFERDPEPPADVADAVLGWERPGTPQLRQSHAFAARAVRLLREEAPDLLGALLAEGANLFRAADHLPPWVEDRAPRETDDEVWTMAVRRPVFDHALHAHALRHGVTVDRRGVTGLLVEEGPRVTGVGLAGGTAYAADVVVDATGRRSRTPRMLGVEFPEYGNDCGNGYYTRYYDTLPGETLPPAQRGFSTGGEVDACAVLMFRGERDTFSLSVQTEDDDESLRVLRDPAAFDAVVSRVPWSAPFAAVGRPLNDPVVMAGQRNVLRRQSRDGRPVATGVLLAGDANATSNPAYGRGVTLALMNARLVRDALEHADPGDQVLAMDAGVESEIGPFVGNSAEVDERTRARWRTRLYGEPELPRPERETFEDLFAAAMRDRDLFDALVRVGGMLRKPEDVLDDPAARERIRTRLADGWRPPVPPLPSHDELAAAAAEAVAVSDAAAR